jgi:putative sigma-54 modulation protein
MVVEFTGRQVEIAPAVRSLAERKIAKLAKVLPGVTHVRVVLAAEKRRRRAEVTVNSPLADLVANALANDATTALGAVFDKLTEQVTRVKTRRREAPRRKAGRGVAAALPAPSPPAPGDKSPRVIRSRRFVARPMTLDEAALLVGNNGDGVLVYRDLETKRISVLYRRRDGNLGLIEPEA